MLPRPKSEDCYASYRGTQRRDYGEIRHPEPVVLVDVDLQGEDDGPVLRLPPDVAAQRRATLLVRPDQFLEPAELARPIRSSLESWKSMYRIATLTQPVAGEPAIEVLHGPSLSSPQEKDLLGRARAVELEALLEFGQAIWRPNSFHYRLITGEHAPAYIKLADAIRQPRDARVLASWLHRFLRDGSGVLLDTGTLTPLAQALESAARQQGISLGQVATLDNYPRTVVDVGATLDRLSGDGCSLLVVISVSSSGSLLERVKNAVARKGASMESQISLMVNKGGESELEEVDIWTPYVGHQPLVPSGSQSKAGCRLCKEPGRAAVVPINPFTFDAMLPTQFEPTVPSIKDPEKNRELWEAARRTEALEVEQLADAAVRRYRSDTVPMGIVMRGQKLIGDAKFRSDFIKRIRELQEKAKMPKDADLVLVPEHEAKPASFSDFWQAVGGEVAPGVADVTPFPTNEPFGDELKDLVKAASSVLVFQLGTVSGGTLQRALVGAQEARGADSNYRLHGFVMHARPATRRELQTIENSYGREGGLPQLRIGWASILPDRSPLREEGILLKSIAQRSLPPAAKQFHKERMSLCGGGYVGGRAPVLWGSDSDSYLTPNSIYGQSLDAVSTYVAVGSAMAAALGAPERMTPELRVFEMAAIARSYYDPLILGSMLRWMRPHETFWGWTAREAKTTAIHLLDRAENFGRSVILPEMLLAVAQGKVTREAAAVAVNAARIDVEGGQLNDEERGILELGLRLAEDFESLPPTEGLHGSEAAKQESE